MQLQKATALIEELIAQGNLEQAMEQLVAFLDGDPQYAELAKTARLNQGELYQVKSQLLKGTIASEDARLVNNQIADKALQIIQLLEKGQLNLEQDAEFLPKRSQVWRYYAMGGFVTLLAAAAVWWFLLKKQADCPTYSKNTQFKVMVLPFLKTGQNGSADPAIEIADGLNVLISKNSGLKNLVGVEVKKNYTEGYPSPQTAEQIATDCDVQMVIWGKINETQDENYKFDVRYRLLGADKRIEAGDTSLSNLLRSKDQGQLIRDFHTVTQMLYIVMANKMQVRVEPTLFASVFPEQKSNAPTTTMSAESAPDSSLLLLLANNVAKDDPAKAIRLYDTLLATYPDLQEARQKRGALLIKQGQYAKAVLDLDAAAPNAAAADPDLLKKRSEAALLSGQPKKAEADIKVLQSQHHTKTDSIWLMRKQKEIQDSIRVLQSYRDQMERKAVEKPADQSVRVGAAKANISLGEPDRALKLLNSNEKGVPKSMSAVEASVEAHLMKKDTVSARRVITSAEKAGMNVKGLSDRIQAVKPLEDRRRVLPQRH